NGDGTDTVGIVRGNVWYLRNSNTSGTADLVVTYGDPATDTSSATGTATAPTPSPSSAAARGTCATRTPAASPTTCSSTATPAISTSSVTGCRARPPTGRARPADRSPTSSRGSRCRRTPGRG